MKMIWSWIDALARFVIRLIGKVSPKLGGLCEKLWNNTELVAYLFAGVATTIVNYVVYYIVTRPFGAMIPAELLTTVNGVGPKAAMAILSAGPQNFTLAVMTGDEKLLTAAQGVGKKIAQRIILELKDKMGGSDVTLDFSGGAVAAVPAQGNNTAMANAALQELGYSASEIAMALKGADPNASTEDLIRHALRAMVMKN